MCIKAVPGHSSTAQDSSQWTKVFAWTNKDDSSDKKKDFGLE